MDLKSGYPFWAIKNGLMYAFPQLDHDISCDVLIVGGGITGALIARELAAESLDVAIIEQRDIAWGSTAASTALLQYEIDTHMVDLAKQYGEKKAATIYLACAQAIMTLRDIMSDVRSVDFKMSSSLYIASSRWHETKMRSEFDMRRKHGIDVDWLSQSDVKERFRVESPCAILSTLAAHADPYRMASRLLHSLDARGVRIYDRTALDRFETTSRSVVAYTRGEVCIQAKHIVFAAGYATQQWIKQKVAANRSSYAFVTDPIDRTLLGPWANTLLWESARPYIYTRTTRDHRLVIGGEDDAIDIPARRDAIVQKKAATLMKRARTLFPQIPLTPDFAWAGTFAETKDGLPFFGAHPQHGPRALFAMAYGGNGITYSVIGGEIIAAIISGRKHPLKSIFGFARLR